MIYHHAGHFLGHKSDHARGSRNHLKIIWKTKSLPLYSILQAVLGGVRSPLRLIWDALAEILPACSLSYHPRGLTSPNTLPLFSITAVYLAYPRYLPGGTTFPGAMKGLIPLERLRIHLRDFGRVRLDNDVGRWYLIQFVH